VPFRDGDLTAITQIPSLISLDLIRCTFRPSHPPLISLINQHTQRPLLRVFDHWGDAMPSDAGEEKETNHAVMTTDDSQTSFDHLCLSVAHLEQLKLC